MGVSGHRDIYYGITYLIFKDLCCAIICMEKKRTTVYISQNAWNKLRHLALDKKKSASQLLEEIIEERLKRER
jgi:hypothetical protein